MIKQLFTRLFNAFLPSEAVINAMSKTEVRKMKISLSLTMCISCLVPFCFQQAFVKGLTPSGICLAGFAIANISSYYFLKKGKYVVAFMNVMVFGYIAVTMDVFLCGGFLAPSFIYSQVYMVPLVYYLGMGRVTISIMGLNVIWCTILLAIHQSGYDYSAALVQPYYVVYYVANLGATFLMLLFFMAYQSDRDRQEIEIHDYLDKLVELEKTGTEIRMAGGFAHEIRNALTGTLFILRNIRQKNESVDTSLMMTNCQLLFDLVEELSTRIPESLRPKINAIISQVAENEKQIHDAVSLISNAIDASLSLTNRTMEFSKIGFEEMGTEDLNLLPIVADICAYYKDRMRELGVQFSTRLCREAIVKGNRDHFEIIFRNLIANALDALESGRDKEKRRMNFHIEVIAGLVYIVIEDNGCGIPEDIQSEIFDAFFTTKHAVGTGLGLSTTRKIVKLYNGTITLTSEAGKGTKFQLTFPSVLH